MKRKILPAAVALILLGLVLCWTAVAKAGVHPEDWAVSLCLIGCIAVFYAFMSHRSTRSPGMGKWPSLLIAAFLGYLVFELLPLPLSLLHVLSPARESLALAAAAIHPGISRAPISVNEPAALLSTFSFLAYAAVFLLMRELTWQFQTRLWLPVVPLFVVGGIEALIGSLQAALGWPDSVTRGTYASRDHFCGLLEMILPIAFVCGFAMLRKRWLARSALYACTAWGLSLLIFVAVIYSLSRGGFLASLAGLCFVGFYCSPRRPTWTPKLTLVVATLLLALAAFLFLSPAPLIDRFAQLFSSGKIVLDDRPSVWKATLSLIGEFRWFGCGLGGFESTFLKHQVTGQQFTVQFAHNDYLQYLAELGFIGFSLLSAALVAVLAPTLRGLQKPLLHEDGRLLTIGCLGAIIAIALHSSIDFNTYIPANAMTLAWIIGVGSATNAKPQAPPDKRPAAQ